MYNSSSIVTSADSRLYVYEVEGLGQNGQGSSLEAPIRRSGTTFMVVPYSRMQQETKRIMQMGGTIVSIRPTNGMASDGPVMGPVK